MKTTKKLMVVLLALMLILSLTLAACGGKEDPSTTTKPTGNSQPSNSQPSSSNTPSSSQKDPSGQLEITVVPTEMEIFAGEKFDPMYGVVASDASATLRISDDGGFDETTPGTYTITYEAILGDVRVTATRTVIVHEALSNIAVEVTRNHLSENKWKGKLLSFPNAMYVELSESAELSTQSGVFKNTSDSEIVLTVGGTYGCSAVIDQHGVVIEGRDGANSKLVNAQNPTRTSSSVTTLTIGGETVSVSNAFAKEMTIPAGGYAIVVQANELGQGGADFDGRSFMNYNVIGAYGNVVRLFWVDSEEDLTTYVNQKPTFSGNSKLLAKLGDANFDLNAAVLAGLVAKDDNGTFDTTDDYEIKDITIVSDGGFDLNQAGTYTVTLSVTDGELTTEFTRDVEVKSDGIVTLFIGENKMNVAADLVAIDQELTEKGDYAFVVFTPNYTGELSLGDAYGTAFILDEYGVIVRIYDGTSAKYHDAENPAGVKDGRCTENGYLTQAFESRQEGETLLVATNLTANNAAGGSRDFLVNNKTIGATVSGLGLEFKTTSTIITIGDKTFEAVEGKWVYNTEITAAEAATMKMVIFDKNFEGNVTLNGWGAAIVLDQYGTLVKIYDAANNGFWTVDGKSTAPLTFTGSDYATVAFNELQEGETLIVFPNDGTNAADSARTFALSLRNVGGECYCGQTATLTGFTFAEKPATYKTITIGDKTFTAPEGMWVYNTEITAAEAATMKMVIFDKNFEGNVTLNGWGAAIVLDQYGTLVKIYDAANNGFWTVDGKSTAPLTFTGSDYATVAFNELQEGETLIVFPNDGTNAADSARTFALSLRNVGGECYCGQTATLTGFTFKEKED